MKRPAARVIGPEDPDFLLLQKEVAERCGVHPNTITHWVADGLLRCIRTPGDRPRFRQSDVDELLEDMAELGKA